MDINNKSSKFNNNILSKIIDNANDAIVITDVNGDIIYVNQKFTKITGYTFVEVIGKNPRILKTDFHEERFYTDLWKKISSGETFECEFKNKRKDGTFYWEFARISPVFDENNTIQYYFAVKKDITAEKEIAKNFETHKELITSIQNFSTDYICIKDYDNCWVFANKNLCDILGINQTDYIGKTDNQINQVIRKNKHIFNKCLYFNKKAWSLGEKVKYNVSIKNEDKDIVINFVKNPLFFKDGSKKAIITVGRDVSELIELQNKIEIAKEKAENANKLKSLFISNISHDLRSPLNAVIGFANILEKDKSLHKNAARYVNIIKESSASVLGMLSDILDITKLESDKVVIKKTNVLVYLVLMEIFEQNILQAQEKHLELILDYKIGKKFKILSDELRIKQILSNLVTNAIKYTKEGTIKISCYIENNNLVFKVKDTGVGISKDKQKYVFDRFYQIEDKSIRQYMGAGLGLSICKLLSEKLRGKIYFTSEENRGSEFYFELPISKIEEDNISKNVVNNNKLNLKNKNILIAEDDMNSVLLYKALLMEANLCFVDNGIDVIKKVKENENFDLILMDIQLPQLSGLEAIKEIRKFNKDIVIIVQTANAMPGDKDFYLSAGSNDYISKPIDEYEFFSIIRKYI